jgi:hypothetical protein
MRRFVLVSALSLFGFVPISLAKHVTLHGYVTAVHSPDSFQMDEYKILDRTDQEHDRILSEGRDYHPPHLKPGLLRVGLEVEVKGDYDFQTGEVKATSLKAVKDDADPAKSVEGMGLVEVQISLEQEGQGWSGRVVADGETIIVTSETQLSMKRGGREKKERQALGLDRVDAAFRPDEIDLDTFAHYTGVRQADHSILATRIEFRQARASNESNWTDMEPKTVYHDPKSESGSLAIGQKEYALFPSPEAADYLSKLGASLIPTHQKELSDKSPEKARFRFFLMDADYFGVDTYPNGVIVVSSQLFDVLENEAQLAFVLAHEMARVVERQQWTASTYHETQRKEAEAAGLAAALVVPGAPLAGLALDNRIAHKFVRSMQNQADRVGIEYMIATGYDPYQSVEFWKVLEKTHPHGVFWGNSGINFLRRTYLASELRLNYAHQDFSSLKRDSAEFHTAADAVKRARDRVKAKK